MCRIAAPISTKPFFWLFFGVASLFLASQSDTLHKSRGAKPMQRLMAETSGGDQAVGLSTQSQKGEFV
jgi:hypothetical protein